MKVYVLEHFAAYEGGSSLQVFATVESALAAFEESKENKRQCRDRAASAEDVKEGILAEWFRNDMGFGARLHESEVNQ